MMTLTTTMTMTMASSASALMVMTMVMMMVLLTVMFRSISTRRSERLWRRRIGGSRSLN